MVNWNSYCWNNWSKETEEKRNIAPKQNNAIKNNVIGGHDNMSDNRNALEPLADSLANGIGLIGTTLIQASTNVLLLSIKGGYELVKLVADVTKIGYEVATGAYQYEIANTIEDEVNFKSIVDVEYKAIDKEVKPLDIEYLELSSFDCGLKDFVKFERHNEVKENSLKCYVGENEHGETQSLDLFKDGSLLIGGASRWGKTSLIYSMLLSFMDRYDPNYLRIVLVDFKEVDLVRIDKYKHVISNCITDVNKLNNLLAWCENECKSRAEIFRKDDVSNIQDFNKMSEIKMQPVIIVIDEIAQVVVGNKKETDKIKDRIFKLVSKSMCFGVYWIVCTQELSRDTLGKMKINFTQSIGLKCADKIASDMIIKDGNLEDIKIKGRAKIENSNGITEFQSYWTTKEDFERILKNKRK